ncbi:engulfment and cell motility protein 1-like [Hydra vulgaris]|uniref:Engulfment and cell motility protein 1-like n=1 Tax=Hydra vulgaris TaxID=6087 RepID=A0ABM4DNU7_HYDVU
MAPSADIKRIAIKKEGYFPILYHLNPGAKLSEVIKEICLKWTITSKFDQHSLQYLDSKIYITEENRADIHDGDILTLNLNVELSASKFLVDIEQPDSEIKRMALDQLAGVDCAGQAEDPLFANEFINRNGVNALVKIIESDTESPYLVAQAISAVQELLEHGFFSWDKVERSFITKILGYANQSKGVDSKIVQRSLSLLDNIVSMSSTLFIRIMNEVKLDSLVEYLKSSDTKLQISTMALCNSILQRMEHENRKKFTHTLSTKGYTNVLQQIIASSTTGTLSSDIKHQLYVYQSLLLSVLEPRLKTKPDHSDPKLLTELNSIYNYAFESAPLAKDKNLGKADFKKLGFVNSDSPLSDFEETPPGMLAYDAMLYFAQKQLDSYVKVILENYGRDEDCKCPFAKSSKHLTKMLCEVLNVGEPISDTEEQFQPMFFTTDNVFEELYCVSIQLLNKTWKEMRAKTAEDFPRVIGVVKDQIKRALVAKPETIEKFKNKAFSLTYQQILRMMQQEAQERNILDSQTKPVIELREQIVPEIRELVRQQRLSQLVEGLMFDQISKRGQQKGYWFCCLSPNHRFLHYGEVVNSKVNPPIDSLPNKIPISEVTSIKVGKDCPHINRLKKGVIQLAFSIMYNQEEHLDFIAPTQYLFSVWTDALNSLLGKEMTSPESGSDLEMLLNMEMKLLLLDLEDVRIPEVPPPIPKEPDNYNFFYKDI